ncbi:Por secretion system C-terminal sorting domain-containing protein [Chitinophaga eiseniae]|uniref:Por secretion system C-terminal sorting domain-containing protein n=1 Tax=Chitinophaga eiseniae TaxID=634771 RepID=A0A1T4SX73_9BACT|nr:T9SS type A sorting domain-containing protein [Chitinophaga eiseniae]SKA32793.1 Por secretion system C-terminal sorting domain-containing protein [Chitinophaga eiseniae]
MLRICLPILLLLSALQAHSRSSHPLPGQFRRPAYFIENKGQVTDQWRQGRTDIDFKLRASKELTIFIGSGKILYQWTAWGRVQGPSALMYRMEVKLAGARPGVLPAATEQRPYREEYYLPGVASGMVAQAYSEVTYKDVYPHIDWVLRMTEDGHLKYDFVVRPGGNPADIRLEYEGATRLSIGADGSLLAATPVDSIIEQAPYAYLQEGQRQVGCSFVLSGSGTGLSFQMAPYKGTLVVDPMVLWGTYFGGVEYDQVSDLVYSKFDSCLYLTGATNSLSNIATSGSYQDTLAGGFDLSGSDAFISKMRPDGSLVWSTYYGGPDMDQGKKVALDSSGVYIAGVTASLNGIATSGSYQPAKGGDSLAEKKDAFLVKFDTSGFRLWATYFGGSNHEGNTSIGLAADGNGHVYLGGNTQSTDIAATPGCHQPASAGGQDGFIARFSSGGLLDWATYYGGSTADYIYDLATDAAGSLLVAGRTQSAGGIATAGAHQPAIGGGQDGFLAKFNPAGQLSWATYYGGSGMDRVYCVKVGQNGNVFLGGTTNSSAAVATTGAHQSVFGGGSEDGIIAAFNPSGQLLWATYYGGVNTESIWGIYCPGDSALLITGPTQSTDSIATQDGWQSLSGGSIDAFVAKFDADNGTRVWGSYLGGVDGDVALAITGDRDSKIFIAGSTSSATQVATPGSLQPAFAGGDADGFLVCVKDCRPPGSLAAIIGPAVICKGSDSSFSVAPGGSDSVIWIPAPGWVVTGSGDTVSVAFGSGSGTLRAVPVNSCATGDTIALAITVNPAPDTPVITRSGNMLSVPSVYGSYQWLRNDQAIAGATSSDYLVSTDGVYSVSVGNAEGCATVSAPININGTGIAALFASYGISIFPNPVTDKLYIQTPTKVVIDICSVVGKRLLRRTLQQGLNVLGLDGLSSGIYLLTLTDNKGSRLGSTRISLNRNL